MAGKRVDASQANERVSKIYELKVLGLSRAEIIQYVSEKTEWNITDRQIDNYILQATERLKAQAEYESNEQLGMAISRLNKLYQSNLKVQDYKGALAVQRELNSLLGLHAPQKVQHTGESGGAIVVKVIRE